ncbi:peptide/nickel transport system ATP-binding protein [Neomicrococcus aestuarii]|uniref:Peptide/nickel transport system ATP-binding protein n=1 Tax=Neomicrococcus aestuarii TaxID=556325 RepID=A0A7W8TTF6_9MICC|nr:ABC transporter ATP-binding protein [Neomicrococcus aestuarii]MBB5512546.1 peptide/nickel transport system ATP-binding protein [Neomicrococcus aestuarii]
MSIQEKQAGGVLRVSELSVQYAQGYEALKNVTLNVPDGQIVAIVGESGSGKSTLAKTLIGLLPRDATVNGRVEIDSENVLEYTQNEWRTLRGVGIGLVPQDPGASLDPVKTIGSQIIEVFKLHPTRSGPRSNWRSKAIELLESVGIDRTEHRLSQYPHELSGGLKQRVLIAIAFALNPKLLIADEPTSALDVTVQRKVLEVFVELARKRNTTVLFVTHDIAVATDIADRILVMNSGKILEDRSVRELVTQSVNAYTKALIAHSTIEPASKQSRGTSETALEVKNLVKTFGSGEQAHTAVDNVSFAIPRGTTFSLVGESGSGKSTTAKIMLSLTSPDSGQVLVNGVDVTNAKGKQRRKLWREVQFVFQNPDSALDPRHSIERIIAEPLVNFKLGSRKQREARVAELLESVNLPERLKNKRPAELSGGQRQRVAIARALAAGAKILVLDEALSALDVLTQEQILVLLNRLQEEAGLTYLFISHDLKVVERISDNIGVLKNGELVETGPATAVVENPQHEYTQRLLNSAPGHVLKELINA